VDTVSPRSGWSYVLQLPHDPRAPRVARMTLRAVLGAHGIEAVLDTAELLACELVTNAYRYSDGPVTLRVRSMDEGWLRVSVWDTNPVIPAPFDTPSTTAHRSVTVVDSGDLESGRGLFLVRFCADNWGGCPLVHDRYGRGGKLLWFELGPAPDLEAAA
jgi:anti-sigma regulatory factor (Ser/Thr protein kinase)